MNFTGDDERFMRRALALAALGRGDVEPNPMVGAVVVRGGKVVGEGFHRNYGGPHAEVHALAEAGRKAAGATLYVTLEPCCHWGKTPPCTDAVIAAGVSRVVAAMIDPFARVRGRGAKILRAKRIHVDVGLLEAEARALNGPFIKRVGKGKPWVIAKWAQTIDGCIATATGESKWISSEESRAQVQVLRGRMDGIIVGIGTALADDPLLMARPARGWQVRRVATRIVFDSECRLPVDSQLVRTVSQAPVMVVHRTGLKGAAEARRKALADRGVMLVEARGGREGRVSVSAAMEALGEREYTNVLLEGGPELLAAFLAAGEVDEAQVFIAPTIFGGKHARRAVGGADLRRLAEAHAMQTEKVERVGPDVKITGRFEG